LQNARLYEAEQQARHVADTLRAANLAMSERLDLDAILETLLDRLGELVPYDSASVMLLDSHAQLTVRAIRGFERWAALEEVRATSFNLHTTPNLRALTTAQKGFIIADTAEYPGWERRAGSEHVRNWLGAPLLAEGRVIGVFALDKREPGFFTETHLRLVEALATQAAIAIQNAHLYQQVRIGRERLRQLTQQVVSAQEEERRRISRELHDEAGQALTALKISLSMMQSRLPASPPSIRQEMTAAVNLTDQTMEHIRLLAQNLRPPALETLGLNSTLDGLCRDFARRTKLPIVYEGVEMPRLPDAITISFYRFVQEALTNVVKHANASQVQVALRRDDNTITVSVSDDGQGFNVDERLSTPAHLEGLGLVGILERLALLGGRLDIESDTGRGTRLVAHIPFPEE
jgi:signal transduction histidine kinase